MATVVIRPDLPEMPEFWRRTQARASDFHKVGIKLHADAQLAAAVLGLNDELSIESVAQTFGAASVLTCVQQLLAKECDVSELRRWVKEACHQPGAVASFLAHTQALNQHWLRVSRPSSTRRGSKRLRRRPLVDGLDGGEAANRPTTTRVAGPYGFKRPELAVQKRGATAVFDVRTAAWRAAAGLGLTNWQQLRDSLPWVRPSDSWDVALRLRLGAVKRCIETTVAPEDYVALASTDGLFDMILDKKNIGAANAASIGLRRR